MIKTIKTVGIVGAGTMGSALAQKFAFEGFRVVLNDRSMDIAKAGLKRVVETLESGVKKNVLTQVQLDNCLFNITISHQLEDLRNCDLIIEAIFEDFKAKSELFKSLSKLVPEDTILATNTSSFSVTELSASVKNPKRFIGLHYFFHAAKNRLVEIIPGEKTSGNVVKAIHHFSIVSGKDPVYSKDSYGFIVNRFFVPWLNEAVRLHEEGIPIDHIERVCKDIFGIGLGPFELMNVTGIPVAYHAEKTLEIFGKLYHVAKALKDQAEKKQLWQLSEPQKMISSRVGENITRKIRERMLGIVFFVSSQLLYEKVCTASDIDRGAKIGLKWKKGPVEMMQRTGEYEVRRLVKKIGRQYKMKVPVSIGKKYWQFDHVTIKVKGPVAVITLNQPENLNALSEDMLMQLAECFDKAERNVRVRTIFLVGSGKAFMAGADIKFFVKKIQGDRICDIEEFTGFGQRIFNKIDHSKKKVVAILNGLTLGGGIELALCSDIILALPKAQIAFPETGIGIYPGLGGTQRSASRIGKGLAKYLILTGKMLSGREAEEIGLVDGIISADEMFALFEGKGRLPSVKLKELNPQWMAIANLYLKNDFKSIIKGDYTNGNIDKDEVAKMVKTMSYKAPVAMQIAEDLIIQGKGPESELKRLREVFSTKDALKGLTNIGKRVEYEGK